MQEEAKKWTETCLGPQCYKIHILQDCEDTTPEKKKSISKKRWEEKKVNSDDSKKAKTSAKSVKQNRTHDLAFTKAKNSKEGRCNILIE